MTAKQNDETLGMVERVAQAIMAKVPQGYGMTAEEATGYARVAIEAMREPTEAMVDAGWDKEVFADGAAYTYLGHVAVEAYQAMIDAALAEES